MANLEMVTAHLFRMVQQERSPSLTVPEIIYSPEGASSHRDHRGRHWRLLSYIDHSRTLKTLDSAVQAEEIGRLLGCFHYLLNTFDPQGLHPTLPGFHVTSEYLKQYDAVIGQPGHTGRKQEWQCTAMIEQFRCRADILECNRERLTKGIIHADPKVGNFLFDQSEDKAISLIDLDTVMPGLLLLDLGDCLRSCCNLCGEDIDDFHQITFDVGMFASVLRGYWNQARTLLKPADLELLVDAAWLISFELGLRFFTDHLAGNRYFKITCPDQNLKRALVQLYLAQSIDRQRDSLDLAWQQVIGY